MTLADVGIVAAIGLAAGITGGLAGIGGSIVMLPLLAILIGYDSPDRAEQHLYAAAAMVVNVFVSLGSLGSHLRARAVSRGAVIGLLPGMTGGIIAGVLWSNELSGTFLKYALSVFVGVYALYSGWKALVSRHEPRHDPSRGGNPVSAFVIGVFAGVLAGLLGIGGGLIMVPLLQVFAGLTPKSAVATSGSVMWLSSAVGASMKVGTLPSLGLDPVAALQLAALMACVAQVGAGAGAWMAHQVPTRALRAIISVLLLVASGRLLLQTLGESAQDRLDEGATPRATAGDRELSPPGPDGAPDAPAGP